MSILYPVGESFVRNIYGMESIKPASGNNMYIIMSFKRCPTERIALPSLSLKLKSESRNLA